MRIRKEEGATLNELLTSGVSLSAKAVGLYAVLLKNVCIFGALQVKSLSLFEDGASACRAHRI